MNVLKVAECEIAGHSNVHAAFVVGRIIQESPKHRELLIHCHHYSRAALTATLASS